MTQERNSHCHCKSGKKYKKCCLLKNQKEKARVQISTVFSEAEEACDSALAQIEMGNLRGGEIEAARLSSIYPNDHMVNFLQGICSLQRERYSEAISFFEKAIHLNPWFTEAYYNLAGLYRQEFKTVESVVCLRKIIEIEGEKGPVGKLAKKDLVVFENTVLESSGKTLDEYMATYALFDKAFDYLRNEHYQEAIFGFQQVLALDPNSVQSHGNIALAYSALGRQKIAIEHLDKALLLDPSYEPAQQNREIISQLAEGEMIPLESKEVLYYKEKLESEGIKRKKPRMVTLSDDEDAPHKGCSCC